MSASKHVQVTRGNDGGNREGRLDYDEIHTIYVHTHAHTHTHTGTLLPAVYLSRQVTMLYWPGLPGICRSPRPAHILHHLNIHTSVTFPSDSNLHPSQVSDSWNIDWRANSKNNDVINATLCATVCWRMYQLFPLWHPQVFFEKKMLLTTRSQ